MKKQSCYHCGIGISTFYAEENGFSLVKCNECGLLYVQERPDDLEISQAHKQGIHSGLKKLNVTGKFNEKKVPKYLDVLGDLFLGPINKSTWLDVGCGHGEFLVAVQRYSEGVVAVRGTEPNRHKQKSAQKRGLNVDYFNIESHEKKYDVVSLLNVWSHLPNPMAFLKSCKELLTPSGEIVIQTGDTADFAAEEHYKPFNLPDHLSFASERIVSDILIRLDFEILSVCKYPYPPINAMTILKDVVKFFLPQYHSDVRYYVSRKRYSQTDMFIRARAK